MSPTRSCSRAPRTSTRRAMWASSTSSSPPTASTTSSQINLMERLGNSDVDIVRSIAAYQQDIKDRRLKLEADKEAAAKLVTKRAAKKSEVLAVQSRLEHMTAGIKNDIQRLQEQQAAAARAAAQAAAQAAAGGASYGGGGSVPDPGGSGNSAVVGIAQRYLGVPYVYAGASPSGFDCSGLAMYCYAQVGVGLSHGATDQQHASTPVPISYTHLRAHETRH